MKFRDLSTLDKIVNRYNSPEEFEKRKLALYREKTGLNLALEVQASKPNLVIDFGCGGNLFKDYIDNLIGIDITPHPNVDIVDDIHNTLNYFKPKSADWIFNFGCIQLRSTDPNPQIKIMSELIKDDGVIVAHTHFHHYKFTENPETFIEKLGKRHGLKIQEIGISYTDTTKMTPEHYEIQKQIAKLHELRLKERLAPRLTWRWIRE